MRTLVIALLLLAFAASCSPKPSAPDTSPAGVEALNKALDAATRKMDNAAILALWEEDGISLLPLMQPIKGKPAISKYLQEGMAQLPGATMKTFDMQCHDITVSGDWASEWCTAHQTVDIPGKPSYDGWGKMLFVLHRGSDGQFRVKQEMWQQAVAP
jgi:ketosteroid isomerase-like protein